MESYDIAVIGLGAHGSSILHEASTLKGKTTIGFDQYNPPHNLGSSGGESRIFTESGSGPGYVALARYSAEQWTKTAHEYESETRKRIELLTKTGALLLGEPNDHGFEQYFETARDHNISHDKLTPNEIRTRFPQFEPGTSHALYEDHGGYIRPEICIQTHIDLARRHGARLMLETNVIDVVEQGSGTIRIVTNRGIVEAGQAVLSVGAWIQQFLPQESRKKMTIYQEAQHWLQPPASKKDLYEPKHFPVFVWEFPHGTNLNEIYGVPNIGSGVKIAGGDPDALQSIEDFRSEVIETDTRNIRDLMRGRFPDLENAPMKSSHVCRFICTPEHDFVIDLAPGSKNLWIVSPCSGKGFKHSSGIGSIVGGHLLDGKKSPVDISAFTFKNVLESNEAKPPHSRGGSSS